MFKLLKDMKETKPHKTYRGGFHQNKIEGSDSLLFRVCVHIQKI